MKLKTLLFGTSSDACGGLLILRIFIGMGMFTHGREKMFGGLAEFTENVAGMGLPFAPVLAFLAAFAESFGALLLAIGLLTRPAAFLLACTMTVAALVAHGDGGFAAQEKAWLYFFPCLLFLLKGAGKWSLDFWISRRK
jgi:putative oxidoreductase